MKKTQQGFTLIELVMVIVIIGILSATAAPKFLDLQKDARIATMEGVLAAAQSASSMIHAKSLIANNDTVANSTVSVNNVIIETRYGYPQNTTQNIIDLLDLSADFNTNNNRISYVGKPATTCTVDWANATATTISGAIVVTPPLFSLVTTGC